MEGRFQVSREWSGARNPDRRSRDQVGRDSPTRENPMRNQGVRVSEGYPNRDVERSVRFR